MKKKDKKWVLLCSTAVAAVYAAGYFTTETQVAQGQSLHIEKNIQAHKTNSDNANIVQKAVQSDKIYKEGTFTGSGWNRRGSIGVQVTIQNDKITDVEITDFAMHYSERDVVGLPDEVLQTQNAQVTNVSGATYSTQAFEDAVQQALDLAKNNQG
ncbi:FMN-binding protein [Paenibacillus sp. BSR1-1]|uniref:FMN-binding protein n=1 Tax=Paenibacillus sp. BSR1-1 TaxID=3020845 RepID=UPI0025B1D968|nr:FMN-binding protein [Paenibacillus sp. BSR1-1]MDN3017341.1 FMN-binding protein [Paenibacillus sp. BSR1-1]